MSDLLDAKGVAAMLGITESQVKRRTAAEGWPCVRFSARTIRYRSEHVEQIIASHEVARPAVAPTATGQTARSRRKASA